MSEPEGHNSERAIYLKHQAIAVLDAERSEAQRKIRKRHRKDAELAGVPLQDMDWVLKTLELPVGEIRKFFTQKLRLLSFNGINVGEKIVDKIIGDHTEDRTYEGQLAGLAGKPASPPANLTPHEAQTWLTGWGDGAKARDEASAQLTGEDNALAEARANRVADDTSAAAAELGGADYGDDEGGEGEEGEGGDAPFEASEDELAAQATRPSVQEAEPDKPPHQAPKKRAKKTTEAVH